MFGLRAVPTPHAHQSGLRDGLRDLGCRALGTFGWALIIRVGFLQRALYKGYKQGTIQALYYTYKEPPKW